MRKPKVVIAAAVCAVALGAAWTVSAVSAGAGRSPTFSARTAQALRQLGHLHQASGGSAAWGNLQCFGVYPITGVKSYAKGCYGQDEPAIDPVSSVPGSGQNITWTIKLPRSTYFQQLLNLGPTFWVGATLSDPSSLADSVFSELQFYPDSSLAPQTGTDINTACTPLGFNVNPDPGTWSICDFSWALYPSDGNFFETPAYVSVVDTTTNPNQPLYLHSGDVITVHIFPSGDSNHDAEQVITDKTTGQSGVLIMNSNSTTGTGSVLNPTTGDGPLTLPYSTNTTNNAMPWGVVDGTPFAFSWEIGHPNFYTHGTQAECVPGQWDCASYDTTFSGWGSIRPLRILSATFGIGGSQVAPSSWATNDSQGGSAEDSLWCGGYDVPGTSLCTFPWYSYSPFAHAILFGATYPGTPSQYSYGEAPGEYAESATCPGPLTPTYGFLYFCSTTLSPSPPIQ
jgi:hypothetical protein